MFLAACSHNRYQPNKATLIAEKECRNLFGSYNLDFEKFGYYENLGFWQLSNYDQIQIRQVNESISFIGYKNGSVLSTFNATPEQVKCQDGVLLVNIENHFLNNGGVSVYEARKIQIYSYKSEEVVVRFQQASSGLFLMVPVSVSEDSAVILHSVK